MGRARRGEVALWTVAAAVGLAGCEPWRCSFESHGACIEFTYDPGPLDEVKVRVDRLLELELPYWGLHELGGWRIQFRPTGEYPCYLADRNEGCTDYIEKTLSVRIPPSSQGCFEASELLHEIGHYALGDPMHSNARWTDVDAAFAPMVWDHPGAPPECVDRYEGVTTGIWNVTPDRF